MRTYFLVVLLGTAFSTQDLEERFARYKGRWKLTDELPSVGTSEHAERLAVFSKNAQLVAKLNLAYGDSTDFSLDDSPFSHLSFQEFSSRIPGMGTTGPRSPESKGPSDLVPPPSSFDWRKEPVGAVTSVKDQGAMGSCWAFSAVGNVEGQRAIRSQGKDMDDLSVEQLIECDDMTGLREVDGTVNSDCGVFGGWPYLAYQYWMKSGGVRTAAEMPYCSGIQFGKPGCCLPCMVHGYNKTLCGNHNDLFCNASTTVGQGAKGLCKSHEGTVAKVTGWRHISSNASTIASELVAIGPLSIALDATVAFQFYKRGVLSPSSHPLLGGCGDNPELNHAVLLIGFGTDGGKDYWIVKNSWGASWGENGYFRFIRGEGRCGINAEVTTAVLG